MKRCALLYAIAVLGCVLVAPRRAAAFAEFEIIVADGPDEGFNDPTPAEPVGGNTGTTLGEQRLQALQHAAQRWGEALDSTVVIWIEASYDPIECVGGFATTLALGGTTFYDFVIDEEGDEVIVPTALGDRIEDTDLHPGEADISIQFNSNLDSRTCLDGVAWYYGLDGDPGSDTDMIDTALHEIGHGLGIQSLHDASTGGLLSGVPSAYLKRVYDIDVGKHWSDMTDAERLMSQGNARKVVWDGPRTRALSSTFLTGGLPFLTSVQVPELSGFYADAAHGTWSVATTVSGELAADTTGQCPPANVNGRVALMPWECAHSGWSAQVEAEGAIAVLVESPTDWELPVMPLDEPMPEAVGIPVIAISTADLGRLIDGALAGAVTVELSIDESALLGADDEGRVMMNITLPETTSSLAHVEPLARPNLLMEPITVPRPLHDLDITPAMLHDIGWVPFCGNGEIDQAEECDQGEDNSDTEPNACRTTCEAAGCGDGVLDADEVCDDGADNSDTMANACRTTCEAAGCGDGVRDTGEACDDGADNSDTTADACRTTCQVAACGDGFADEGETCDEGPDNSDTAPNACRVACFVASCGDGVIDDGEACDDGEGNDDDAKDACRTTCVEATCGDGVVDTGEVCDPETGMPCNADCSSENPDTAPIGDGGVPGANGGDGGGGDEGGCGCRVAGRNTGTPRAAAWWIALGLIARLARRKR
jgi:MYXO-CTERM domain-containing protein